MIWQRSAEIFSKSVFPLFHFLPTILIISRDACRHLGDERLTPRQRAPWTLTHMEHTDQTEQLCSERAPCMARAPSAGTLPTAALALTHSLSSMGGTPAPPQSREHQLKANNTKFCHRSQQFFSTHTENHDFHSTFVFTYTEVNPTSQNAQ